MSPDSSQVKLRFLKTLAEMISINPRFRTMIHQNNKLKKDLNKKVKICQNKNISN